MRAKVHVSLKAGVLDPQGKAVGDALGRLGFALMGSGGGAGPGAATADFTD